MSGRGPRRVLPLAVLGSLLWTAAGCVSSSDIETLSSQLNDVQQQLLHIQKQASTRQEVASLERSLGEQMERVIQSEADMQVRLDALSSEIERLQAKLEDTNYRLAQLSQQIASTNQELRAFRTQPRSFEPPAGGPDDELEGEPGTAEQRGAEPRVDPKDLYQRAYDDYLRGNYDLAI